MTKIFKQLARHWAVCLVVFALLFVQAYCDLSLPDYTSKIVDTGIQQGGIESPLPDTVRQSTLDALSLLMREEDAAAFQNAYTADGDVLRLRTDLTADERTALEDAVTTPDIVLYLAAAQAANTPAGQTGMGMTGLADLQASGADRNPDTETETAAPTAEDLDTVCGQFAAMSQMPGFSRDAVQQQLTGAIGQLDDTVVENLKSQALLLVGLEYEAQGIAHAVQMHYLYKVGGQMLALTLLMVAVSIAVGFLASRVSAAIGRDLRRETFSSVIHFSNAEIENFSTASLITRTTNDIQQVQFVCVMLLRMVAYAPILGIGGVITISPRSRRFTILKSTLSAPFDTVTVFAPSRSNMCDVSQRMRHSIPCRFADFYAYVNHRTAVRVYQYFHFVASRDCFFCRFMIPLNSIQHYYTLEKRCRDVLHKMRSCC